MSLNKSYSKPTGKALSAGEIYRRQKDRSEVKSYTYNTLKGIERKLRLHATKGWRDERVN